MGGYTAEWKISIQSGERVYSHINPEKYEVYKVHVLKEGWYAMVNHQKYPIDKRDFSFIFQEKKIVFDLIYNIIHGTPGEDGYLQAYFDLLGIKHTSCPFYSAALTFNKKDCLTILNRKGIKSAPAYFLDKGDEVAIDKIIDKVGVPCFVKPNKSGSSLGASKVSKKKGLLSAIDHAFCEDDEVIIETFLEGKEVSVGVVDYKGKVQVLGITEIVSKNEFFDYDAKYNGQAAEITPAPLSEEEEKRVKEISIYIYNMLKIKGMSRSEYIIVEGEPYFIEMNINPGMSQESILPKQAEQAGVTLQDLIEDMIERSLIHL